MSSLIWRGLGAACKNPIHIIVVRGVGTEEGEGEADAVGGYFVTTIANSLLDRSA